MNPPSRLTDEAIEEIETMVARRMARFDETRQEACEHILDTLRLLNDD